MAVALVQRAWDAGVRYFDTSPHYGNGRSETIDRLRPYVDFLAETFGPTRLMWGSDWPVVNLRGTYQSWYAATIALTAGWSPEDRAALMGGTARRLYGL